MLQLQGNCRAGKIAVFPKNWNTARASIKNDWCINYWFYDDNLSKKRQIRIRGMNHIHDLKERQNVTKAIIQQELSLLKKGYNYITEKYFVDNKIKYEIDPLTPFVKALWKAMERVKCEQHTIEDIRSILKYFEQSVINLEYDNIPIGEVRKKHIRYALDNCKNIKKVWSANQFNKYRTYISLLFSELCEIDAVEFNPVRDISKQKTVKKIRATLTEEERRKINEYLPGRNYNFYRFMQIFFHSGARETELLRLKCSDVELHNQRYLATIKKGKIQFETWKTIKDIALPFWAEVMKNGAADDFVFGIGLYPNSRPTTNTLIGKYWRKYVKNPLGITADFYALKHLNTSETVSILSDEDAARLNSHSSTAMVVNIYDTKRQDRQHERLKKLTNQF